MGTTVTVPVGEPFVAACRCKACQAARFHTIRCLDAVADNARVQFTCVTCAAHGIDWIPTATLGQLYAIRVAVNPATGEVTP